MTDQEIRDAILDGIPLPPGTRAHQLYFDWGRLTSLPSGLWAEELYLHHCTGLIALPSDLNVRRLHLWGCTRLTALPEDLKVDYLDIQCCPGLTGKDPEDWCRIYGARVANGVATLFKAVDDNYHSPYRGDYTPGRTPYATDWDGGAKECGGGLHFCPTPRLARTFNNAATRYVACPVRLRDFAFPKYPLYPHKVKARCCCASVWECDEFGEKILTTF
ncbi:MAG: hypothetical protein KGL39_42940 [Patescibacteria group bacterium]|nr:hypothetical protein [Patescibacteria group bacterium]